MSRRRILCCVAVAFLFTLSGLSVAQDDPFGSGQPETKKQRKKTADPPRKQQDDAPPKKRQASDDDPFGGSTDDPFARPKQKRKRRDSNAQSGGGLGSGADPFGGEDDDPFGAAGGPDLNKVDPFGAPDSPQAKRRAARSAVRIVRSAQPDAKSWRKRVIDALDHKSSFEHHETPLEEVIEFLMTVHDIPILMDTRALDDVGLTVDQPITIDLTGVSLRSGLTIMLGQIELTWLIDDAGLLITTMEAAEARMETRITPVADIVKVPHPELVQDPYDMKSLIELIKASVEPESWDTVGGPASLERFRGSLVISQVEPTHQRIANLLTAVRGMQAAHRTDPNKPPTSSIKLFPENAALAQALEQNVAQVNFEDTMLGEAANFLSTAAKIPILIDVRALEDYGLATDTPVNLQHRNIKLKDVLRLMLEEHELTYVIRNEVCMITTIEESEANMDVRIYPVYDLAIDDMRRPWPFRSRELHELKNTMTATVAPDSWDDVGGPGSVSVFSHPTALVVQQTHEVHEQVENMLNEIRVARKKEHELDPTMEKATDFENEVRLISYTIDTLGDSLAASEVVALIQQVVNPQDAPGMFALGTPGRLIVRHSEKTHRDIQKLLIDLNVWRPTGPTGFGGGGLAPVVGGGGGGGFF